MARQMTPLESPRLFPNAHNDRLLPLLASLQEVLLSCGRTKQREQSMSSSCSRGRLLAFSIVSFY